MLLFFILYRYFYAMIVCIVIVATVRDYFVETQGKGK